MTTTSTADLTAAVREKYGAAARRVLENEGVPASCCSSTNCCDGAAAASCDPITSNLYAMGETSELPSAAVLASLGCGNPTALAELKLAKSCSIWAPAAESTSCSRRAALAPPAWRTAWT